MARPSEVADLHADAVSAELGYLVSPRPEPHAARRREMLARHPEIEALFGFDRTQSYATFILVAAQFAIARALGIAEAPWWLVGLLAYAFGAVANHWMGVVIHEAAHNLTWPGGAVPNRIVAMVANLPVLVPSANSFRRYHGDHHLYLGVERLDNDLPMKAEVRWVENRTGRKLVWYTFFSLFAVLARDFFRKPDRWEAAGVLLQGLVIVSVVGLWGWLALGYLLLSTFFAFGLHPIAAHWVHEHYQFDPGQETYSYYGPLNKLTFNMGYHVEHHDFPNIPGSRLPALHSIGREYYSGLTSHNSWSGLLWRFFTDPTLGHHSRVVRSFRTWQEGRGQADPEGSLARACGAHFPGALVTKDEARA